MRDCDGRAVMDDESTRVETDGESIKSFVAYISNLKAARRALGGRYTATAWMNLTRAG